jgi:hypothetical protein
MSRHDHLYDTAGWEKRRVYQLRIEPLCRMCAAKGLIIPATVVDHVEPHRGDINAFVLGDLQSMCKPCHDRHKQRLEIDGFVTAFDASGWPLDLNHPSYLPNSQKAGVGADWVKRRQVRRLPSQKSGRGGQ